MLLACGMVIFAKWYIFVCGGLGKISLCRCFHYCVIRNMLLHIKRDMLIQSSVWVIDLHFIQDQNLENVLDSIFLFNHVFVFDCLDADTKPAEEVNGLKCIYMLEQSMQM
jgi:hypothetical protein